MTEKEAGKNCWHNYILEDWKSGKLVHKRTSVIILITELKSKMNQEISVYAYCLGI